MTKRSSTKRLEAWSRAVKDVFEGDVMGMYDYHHDLWTRMHLDVTELQESERTRLNSLDETFVAHTFACLEFKWLAHAFEGEASRLIRVPLLAGEEFLRDIEDFAPFLRGKIADV